ncbi:DUF5684 domain-containing protein [Halopelagius longus]|uniref:Signal peptidase I n=2 Tax=Halopelagius longus TaxID=1236180 RepID=A0A1H0XPB4_9EURY|nr:DUF5684 domain-containing protein [Halopelagius longus]SDQ04486.1 hypothetical protein SAMN05216278_0035 [Halopelagius longus]
MVSNAGSSVMIPLQSDAGAGLGAVFFLLLILAFFFVPAIGMWKTFVKAGQPGWGAFVPFLNFFYLVEIADRPTWWVALPIIPVIGWILMIALFVDVAKQFGKGPGTGLGLAVLPFVFWPFLGFGDAEYLGDTNPGV